MPEENINNTDLLNTVQNQANVSPSAQTPIKKQPSESPNRPKIKLFAFIGVVTISLLVIRGIILYLNQQKQPESSEIATNTTSAPALEAEDSLEPPELYSEFEWVEIDETSPNSLKNGNPDSTKMYLDSNLIDYEISGKEYSYGITIPKGEAINEIILDFEKYYTDYFQKNDWNISNDYNGKELDAIAAGGPSGNLIGYVKILEDKARLVVILDNNGVFGRPDYNCPCDLSFNVFVSDIIDLNKLLGAVN